MLNRPSTFLMPKVFSVTQPFCSASLMVLAGNRQKRSAALFFINHIWILLWDCFKTWLHWRALHWVSFCLWTSSYSNQISPSGPWPKAAGTCLQISFQCGRTQESKVLESFKHLFYLPGIPPSRKVYLVQLQLARLPWEKNGHWPSELSEQWEVGGDHWPAFWIQDWVDLPGAKSVQQVK